MHILLVADGRSPITRRWIRGLSVLNHKVTLISTSSCVTPEGVENLHILPVAFSGLGGGQGSGEGIKRKRSGSLRKLVARYRRLFQKSRYVLGPLTVRFYSGRYRRLIAEIKPDLVHALRIPFEGMLASYTPPDVPLAISIWGNDLTLHGRRSAIMRRWTKQTLRRADGLIVDVQRDLRLSREWDFPGERPSLVALTSGGIDMVEMFKLRDGKPGRLKVMLPEDVPLVVNPRGLRPGYVRNDIFFQSIPLLLERWPNVSFICPSMQDQPEAMRWVERLKISDHIRLLPYLSQEELWELFLRSQITVSLTTHDGTPNTLLEAMACGCFPIVGDIESLREWIVPGVNGLLVEPDKPQDLAEALLLALENNTLRSKAAEINMQQVRERAEVNLVRSQVEVFYQRLTAK
jgi:glycosyltransferase involved in cell wall biosynthesis